MIKLYCPFCGEQWEKVGNAYKRHQNSKIDYYCSNCQSKKKPIRKDTPKVNVVTNAKLEVFGFPTIVKKEVIEENNILAIGDIHEPFCLAGYREFCLSIYRKYNCNRVVFMGDIIDQHFSSFHATDPDGLGAGSELDFAIDRVQEWSDIFPEADVCLGNHDKIILRKAYASGISKRWIKDFKDVLGVNWNFQPSHVINNILFRHGMGQKAAPKAGSEFMSVIQGHFHTESYIQYRVGQGKMVFGAQCPCGIDRKAYAMAYAEEHPKEAIGCMVVRENGRLPIIEMMEL